MTGFKQSTWNGGIAQARLGDTVFCPRCQPHQQSISQASGMRVFGIQSALEGDMTSCGAILLAERATSEEHMAAAACMAGEGFDDRFLLFDCDGSPMAYTFYALQRPNGEMEHGRTDGAGYTHLHLSGAQAEDVSIFIEG